ncbi:MAG: sigma 54-interacting transcriptional regulator [Thermotaleaceae bacterium]
MFQENPYITQFTDMMSEGFIFIDNRGNIQIYNHKAKEIFGVIYNPGIGHEAGKIEFGDMVILADNSIGRDDGGLSPEDLSLIGLMDKNIEVGDSLIAVGVFKGQGISPQYRYQKKDSREKEMVLNTIFRGLDIHIKIDFSQHVIDISINQENFQMHYVNAIGHMVLLDGETKKIKFYQSLGYTIREEGIYNILKGKNFLAKGKGTEVLNVIGRNIFQVHGEGNTIKEFYKAAAGENIQYQDKLTEINGRHTLCTLLPVDQDGKRIGAVLKVEDISELRKIIRERDEALKNLDEIGRRLKDREQEEITFPKMLGDSEELLYAKKLAYRASKSNSTVLLLGESGTGKSLFAEEIHGASKFHDKPFVHVNCASIPENLLESELFGYEKGAFTGAKNEGKKGLFEAAQGGTIFLDEIGELTPYLQGKLLQVLQSKTFMRLGSTKTIQVDLRIIAATNRNLEQEMMEGRFREDLYYRINVFPILIPPLRDRKQDIYPLVYGLLPKICTRIDCENKGISAEALQVLAQYQWPGNIRELENVLERAANIAEGNTILSTHLSILKKKENHLNKPQKIGPVKETLERVEKQVIEEALNFYNGEKQLVMKALGIQKTQFYEKLKKYSINVPKKRN